MTGSQIAGTISIALMLVLVGGSLAARRIPPGRYVRMGLLWLVIVTVVTAVVLLLQLPNGS